MDIRKRSRVLAGLACALAIVVVAGYAVVSATGSSEGSTLLGPSLDPVASVEAGDSALEELPSDRRVLVRAVDESAPLADGRLYELSASGARRVGRFACKRVHVNAAGDGLCLALSANGIDYEGIVFGTGYRPRVRFPIVGVPDRARVSPDGRFGAFTSFNRGAARGYFASSGAFTTYTRIVDMRTGEVVLSLEQLDVREDDRPFQSLSPQFWGVTFTGGDRYYATLASGRKHFLVEGRVGSERAHVIERDVECPAISPDGERVAYKRRLGNTNRWRLHVLDLSSGEDLELAETRSIDDQPEWLGDDLVAYSDDRDLFAVEADGSGVPQRLAEHATSPSSLPSDR